ncbi:hypothetical protein Cgig2_027894 [Carnegiea gigantea]|uniref:Uncharacterized protein n=1 Tax=Carnegiea gigantea TaxID=171969 RepID=A0A9Q1QKA6_9CARY|nr:hypothetical protein Cgig2_027894 [Carnegiea gigantea]
MERNLALTLVKAWVSRSKAFRLADRLVPFSIFDVALLIGLPATKERVEFDDDSLMAEYGNMVRALVQEAEQEELRRWKVGEGRMDNHVCKNFITIMVYLCKRHAGEEKLQLWLKLYTWLVLSGLFFRHSTYGVAWEMELYANDVEGMSQHGQRLCVEALQPYFVHPIQWLLPPHSGNNYEIYIFRCDSMNALLGMILTRGQPSLTLQVGLKYTMGVAIMCLKLLPESRSTRLVYNAACAFI